MTSGNGTWQFSTNNGSSWSTIGTVSNTSALLLRDVDLVRFVPNGQNGTSADITFRAWDQTSGTYGTKVDTSVNGGSSAFSTAVESAAIDVSAVNDAPLLDNSGTMTLISKTEDQASNTGQTIAAIIASAGGDRITDVDIGAVEGIAIFSLTAGNGVWQYSVNAGASWIDVGTVSNSWSLLLRSSDRIRYVPDGQNGTLASITFRAWDQTSGAFGRKESTLNNGGVTPYSLAVESAWITITSVNDAPVLDNSGNMSLATIATDDINNGGSTVTSMIASAGGDRITDVDIGAVEGIAITAIDSGYGTWQFSTDNGSNWSAIGAVSNTSALLLRSNDRIRLVPNGSIGAVGLSFRAWDQTSGSFGTKVSTSANGGTTAFSAVVGSATIQIVASNPFLTDLQGSHLFVYGNGNDNLFTWTATNSMRFTIDNYQFDVPSGVDTITFVGDVGTDTMHLTGSAGDDSLVAYVGSNSFASGGMTIEGQTVELIDVDGGGGNDTADLYDSAGDDLFSATPETATLTGPGFAHSVSGFAHVIAHSSGGLSGDQAFLYDSLGDDVLVATPEYAELTAGNVVLRADGFAETRTYSCAGADHAALFDSTSDDHVYGTLSSIRMVGDEYFNVAVGFRTVDAFATTALDMDRINLTATDATQIILHAGLAEMTDGVRQVNASGFTRQDIQGSTAPDAVVQLYGSAGNDAFRARETFSVLNGAGYVHRVNNFNAVQAIAGVGGNDTAYFFDTVGDDLFQAQGLWASLTSGSRVNSAIGFGRNIAYSTGGVQGDVAVFTDSPGDDQYWGYATLAVMKGAGYENRANGFDRSVATSSSGGSDTAYLMDSAGDDFLTGDMSSLKLSGVGFSNMATGFHTVYATATAGGNDSLDLSDSAGDDLVLVGEASAQLLSPLYWVYANGFGSQVIHSDRGGADTVRLTVGAGADAAMMYADHTEISGSGFSSRVDSFRYVYASAVPGTGSHELTLWGSAGPDAMQFDADFGVCESANWFRKFDGFSVVTSHYDPINDSISVGVPDYALNLLTS